MKVNDIVVIGYEDNEYFITGETLVNPIDSHYKYDTKYYGKENSKIYFVITKQPSQYPLFDYFNINVTIDLDIPQPYLLNTTLIHPLFTQAHSLLEFISIQYTDSINSSLSSPQFCIPPSGENTVNLVYSFPLPLRSLPTPAFSILQDMNSLPFLSTIFITCQSITSSSATLQSKQFLAVIPKELRQSYHGKVLFYPGWNCKLVGGSHSCLFTILDTNLPFSYYGYFFTESQIIGYFLMVFPDCITTPTCIEDCIKICETTQSTEIAYDLCSLLLYSQNTPNLKYSVTPFIQAHLPLLREMPDSSLLRLIEAMSIRFKDSAPIQSLTDQTLQEQACFLQSIGISSSSSSSLVDNMTQFQELGGSIIFQPSDTHSNSIPVVISPYDIVLSICHEGMNRSQVLLQAVKSIQHSYSMMNHHSIDIFCHGAVSGYDPNQFFDSFKEEERYQFIHTSVDASNDASIAFSRIFHESKSKRLGCCLANDIAMNWNEATSSIVLSNRQFLFNYFSQVLWSGSYAYWPISSLQSNSHVFFFCFYKSFPITLKRLLENCLYEPDCYKNFTIICLPYQDIISQLPSKQSSLHLLENAYLLYYHSLLSSFLFAKTPTIKTLSIKSSSSSSSSIQQIHHLHSSYYLVQKSQKWFIARMIEGTQQKRQTLYKYLQYAFKRLTTYGWPSPIKFDSIQPYFINNEQVDLYLYGPIHKEDIHCVDFSKLNKQTSLQYIKEIIQQLTLFHEAGIVYHNLFYSNIFIYKKHVCLFDLTYATTDPWPNPTISLSILHPLRYIKEKEILAAFPFHLIENYWKNGCVPTVVGDSFLLGILWWIVDSSKREFIENNLLCESNKRLLPCSLLSLL